MNIALFGGRGGVEEKQIKLVKDLKGVVTDTDDLLREVANSSAAEFAAARAGIEARLREARCRLDEARISVTRKALAVADHTQEYVTENPWKVVAVAASAGLIAALLLSRR